VPKSDSDVRVIPSLLDRLIDSDYKTPRDVSVSRAESLRELKAAVQRDLEHLLNARNPNWDLDSAYTEAGQSVIAYGMPDFSSLVMPNDERRLRLMVEAAIRTFEPRLTGVTTALLEPSADRRVQLRIDGRLLIDPSPEAVSFDMVMPLQAPKKDPTKDMS
jgi:type VI secretion system protein ImpF